MVDLTLPGSKTSRVSRSVAEVQTFSGFYTDVEAEGSFFLTQQDNTNWKKTNWEAGLVGVKFLFK